MTTTAMTATTATTHTNVGPDDTQMIAETNGDVADHHHEGEIRRSTN